MILDILRAVTLSLALFFLGINIAIIKRHFERPGIYVTLGRVGITASVVIIISLRLFHAPYDAAGYVINLLLIPSFLAAIIGGLRYYREQERIEHPTKAPTGD